MREQLDLFEIETIPADKPEIKIFDKGDIVSVTGTSRTDIESTYYVENFEGKEGRVINVISGKTEDYYELEFTNGTTGLFYEEEIERVSE